VAEGDDNSAGRSCLSALVARARRCRQKSLGSSSNGSNKINYQLEAQGV
jgi:hypothetical protein